MRRLVLCSLALAAQACCAYSAPAHDGYPMGNFDGSRFHNQQAVGSPGFGAFLRWRMRPRPGPWREWTDAAPGPRPPRDVSRETLRVTFVNHSTVLIQTAGLNILTDPIWSERASPVSWAGPRRARPPGIRFEDLPSIHVVLVSHNHYDHLDLSTLERLQREHRPRFVVGLGNGALLATRRIPSVVELGWWQRESLGRGASVTMVPAQHFSSRGLCDRYATLWGGFVIDTPAGRVYFAGDTGYGPHFREIRERLGPLRLAILPIGAFKPRWFMRAMHVSPEEAVQAHRELGARTSLAVHFGTFRLGEDGQDEPLEELVAAMRAARVTPEELWVLGFGEGRDVP